MHLILAAFATWCVYAYTRRYVRFVTHNFNTQAFLDPETVPDRSLLDKADSETLALTQAVKIPQAAIGTGYGNEIATTRLNPSIPAVVDFGNTLLDTPSPVYLTPKTPAETAV